MFAASTRGSLSFSHIFPNPLKNSGTYTYCLLWHYNILHVPTLYSIFIFSAVPEQMVIFSPIIWLFDCFPTETKSTIFSLKHELRTKFLYVRLISCFKFFILLWKFIQTLVLRCKIQFALKFSKRQWKEAADSSETPVRGCLAYYVRDNDILHTENIERNK